MNLIATFLFNIRAFGLAKGLRLPVYIYGNIKIVNIGKIDIRCPLRRGLIVIGKNRRTVVAPYTFFNNTGCLEVHERLFINYGTMLSNSGTIVFRGNNIVGNQSEIRVVNRLDMGYNTILGFNAHVIDTDMHFMVDVNTHRVSRDSAPITLGKYNWFGSDCYIKKGTVTPDYLTVASPNTLLNKDYSDLPHHAVLAGTPAKVVKQGVRRICNYPLEYRIRAYFDEHPEADYYQIDADASLDDVCTLQFSTNENHQ